MSRKNYSQPSERYAKALYQVSQEANSAAKTLDALRDLGKAIQNLGSDFYELSSPVISVSDKQKIFVESLKDQSLPEEVTNLVGLLVEKRRLALLPEIVVAFQDYSDQLNQVARGAVESTTSLVPEERVRIEELISKVTKKKAILEYKTSPELIGGLVARVGGYTFDDSLDTQLTLLSEYLKRRSH